MVVEDKEEIIGRVLLAYGTHLTEVSSFRYLRLKFLSFDNNWTEVERNLRGAQAKRGQLAKILGREGADKRTAEIFYMEVVQAVLLFGYNRWVLNPRLKKSLKGFNHRSDRRMTGIGTKRQRYGTWVYPPIEAALPMVGLEDIGVYIALLHNTVTQYITNRPIMDLCLAAERKPGMCLSRQWWEQLALDIQRIRAGHAEAEGGEETGT